MWPQNNNRERIMNETTITTGTTVTTKDGRTGTIAAIKGRWLTVTNEAGEFKVSKGNLAGSPEIDAEITQTPDAELTQTPDAEIDAETETETETDAELSQPFFTCPKCGNEFAMTKHNLAIQCPECGYWVYVRIPADRSRYVRGLAVTANGNDTLDIGDKTADLLRGLTEKDCITTAAEFMANNKGLWSKGFAKQIKASGAEDTKEGLIKFFIKRYENRNVGMVRMNCGNLIRGIIKKLALEVR
jgi:DNA-directed RNA polymerase subunit RPC12/RpoP